jgi:hypothetical protein
VTCAPPATRELHREGADAAGGAGDEHAAAEQVAALAQRAQRGQPGDRAGPPRRRTRRVWQRGEPMARDHRLLATSRRRRPTPATRVPGRRAAAVGRLAAHDARESCPGRHPSARCSQQVQLAAVDRDTRGTSMSDVVRAGIRRGQLAAVQAARARRGR